MLTVELSPQPASVCVHVCMCVGVLVIMCVCVCVYRQWSKLIRCDGSAELCDTGTVTHTHTHTHTSASPKTTANTKNMLQVN